MCRRMVTWHLRSSTSMCPLENAVAKGSASSNNTGKDGIGITTCTAVEWNRLRRSVRVPEVVVRVLVDSSFQNHFTVIKMIRSCMNNSEVFIGACKYRFNMKNPNTVYRVFHTLLACSTCTGTPE